MRLSSRNSRGLDWCRYRSLPERYEGKVPDYLLKPDSLTMAIEGVDYKKKKKEHQNKTTHNTHTLVFVPTRRTH